MDEFFKEKDETGKRFQSVILTAAGTRTGTSGMAWRGINPTEKGRHWAIPGFIRPLLPDPNVTDVRDALDALDEINRVIWPVKANGTPRFKQYEDDRAGVELQSIWTDIRPVAPKAKERTGYPTQKPESLLERLLVSTTVEGDVVMDAFAGSGTLSAVAEKLGRRWMAIECGKLAVYTIQNRLLELRAEVGNKGKKLPARPFTLYNAGLYDFSRLRDLPWDSWRFFALQLFQCREDRHRVGGIELDGRLKGASVLVFNHMKEKGVRIDEETIDSLHHALGSRIGNKLFIIAPALTFDFQQDYIDLDGVRYYALRIPYSIIHELHNREFTALKQPTDEMEVNDTVDAVGFDFIRTPELKFSCGRRKPKGQLFDEAYIRITTFKSEAIVREALAERANLETLSMVMLDFDYDDNSQVFDLDAVFYGDAIRGDGGEVRFRADDLGDKVMAVFIDIYGNESRVLIESKEFGNGRSNGKKKMPDAAPKASRNATKKPTKKMASRKKATANKKKTTRKRAGA